MNNIKWTKSAANDLDNVKALILEKTDKKPKEVVLRIMQIVSLLATSPDMGETGRIYGTKEFSLSEIPFIIVYRVWEDEFQVLKILNNSNEIKKLKMFV